MSQLVVEINEPPESGGGVMLTLMEIPEHDAPLVEVVVRQNLHCHEVTYNGYTLQFLGQMVLEDPEDPELELFALSQAVWDVLDQHYCETVLVLYPREPGQRVFTLESDSYEAYLNDTMRLRLQERRKELRLVRKEERE
jgi:hypothetical protein